MFSLCFTSTKFRNPNLNYPNLLNNQKQRPQSASREMSQSRHGCESTFPWQISSPGFVCPCLSESLCWELCNKLQSLQTLLIFHFHPITGPQGNLIFFFFFPSLLPAAPFSEITALSSRIITPFVHMFICLCVADLGLFTAMN